MPFVDAVLDANTSAEAVRSNALMATSAPSATVRRPICWFCVNVGYDDEASTGTVAVSCATGPTLRFQLAPSFQLWFSAAPVHTSCAPVMVACTAPVCTAPGVPLTLLVLV